MPLVPQSSPPSSGVRPRWPVLVLAIPFLASILGSCAWFNTDLGRLNGRGQMTDDRNQRSALTFDARCFIVGNLDFAQRICPNLRVFMES